MSEERPAKLSKRQERTTEARIVGESYSFSGPIPPPGLLNQYDEQTRSVIVSMAKTQSTHRQSIESSVIQSNIRNERAGMFIAGFLTFSLIVAGVILLALDKDLAGYASIFGPPFFHAGNYIYNRRKEEEVKSKDTKED